MSFSFGSSKERGLILVLFGFLLLGLGILQFYFQWTYQDDLKGISENWYWFFFYAGAFQFIAGLIILFMGAWYRQRLD